MPLIDFFSLLRFELVAMWRGISQRKLNSLYFVFIFQSSVKRTKKIVCTFFLGGSSSSHACMHTKIYGFLITLKRATNSLNGLENIERQCNE